MNDAIAKMRGQARVELRKALPGTRRSQRPSFDWSGFEMNLASVGRHGVEVVARAPFAMNEPITVMILP